MKKHLLKIFKKKKTAFLLLAFIGLCSFQANAQKTTNYLDTTSDGLWATVGNWSNGLPIAGDGDVANLTESVDLGGVNREIGQLLGANNTNTKTYSNGTLTLNGTTVSNTDQIIRIRSNKTITVTCDVVVGVDGKDINIRNNATSQLVFDGGFAIGTNTVHVDNNSTATTAPIPVQFNGAVTGSGTINIEDQNISTGAAADFTGFTGSITFDGTNALLTVNGANTIEGSIGVLAGADGNSKIEFMASQSGLDNLTVDTQNLAIDFDAAATSVVFSGYTTSTTEGVVDLQNYVSGSLKIGTTATSVPAAVLSTWTLDGAAATLTQDATGAIVFAGCSTPDVITTLAATAGAEYVTLSWDAPTCFDEVLVVAKEGSAVTVAPTGDGSAYTADADFGSGTDLGTSEYAVFKGTSNAADITGLTKGGTTYHFEVFTRKGTTWSAGVTTSATTNNMYTSTSGGNSTGLNWEDASSWIAGVIPSSTSDDVTINTGIIINSDVDINNIIINNRVTINAGFSLNVNDLQQNSQFILQSTSEAFASVIATTLSGTGTLIYNRWLNDSPNNDLISSPVSGVPFSSVAAASNNEDKFFINPSVAGNYFFGPFNNTTGLYETYTTPDDDAVVIGTGKGYRAATIAGEASTVRFVGDIEIGDLNIDITDGGAGGGTLAEWNLIGNPYPSYLDFGAFFTANSGEFHLDNVAVYGWNGTDYTVWNGTNSSDKLTPGQGFFVRTKDATTGNVDFTTAMRTIGNSDDFVAGKSANSNRALAKINLSRSTKTYATNVYFIENKTKGLDFGFDAGAYSGSATGIYTNLVEDNKGLALAIQSLPYEDYNNIVVPVTINSDAGEQLTISIDKKSSTLPENTYVFLKDNVLNTTTLLNDSDYLFTPDTALSGSGRFFLEFSASSVLSTDEFAVNEMLIYTNQATKSIIIKGLLKTDASAKVFDIQGRMVLEQKIESTNITNVINANSLNTGIYLIQLEGRTQKVIIN
ncbi:T9SS type A sorting domain-containing protein [Polaribacter sp. KT25b]|uniref:T9SS type A sorting domain-containing protein n=1 Tax=Polaribacter sp. KT25b TaxID=1855336 RepID=UPI0012FD92AC|nr:T9SS type A sorting domain-containing protein [Polaribacter sp. KT25b]